MSAQLDKNAPVTGDKRKHEGHDGQADSDCVRADPSRRSIVSGRPVNFCLSAMSFTFLGAQEFDGRPPLVECANSGCGFDHDIPTVPVSVNEKVRLINQTKLIKNSPQRLTALLKVFNDPKFSV